MVALLPIEFNGTCDNSYLMKLLGNTPLFSLINLEKHWRMDCFYAPVMSGFKLLVPTNMHCTDRKSRTVMRVSK